MPSGVEKLFQPQELDIFFTSGRDFASCVFNRSSAVGFKRRRDYTVPTHTGFLTHEDGQWFCTELNEDGIESDSSSKYIDVTRKNKSAFHSVYRWTGFSSDSVVEAVLQHLAALRQQDSGYDWFGAIRCNRFVRRFLPFIKESKKKQYCSENVFQMLKWKGLVGYPKKWDSHDPHPHFLNRFMALNGAFKLIWEA